MEKQHIATVGGKLMLRILAQLPILFATICFECYVLHKEVDCHFALCAFISFFHLIVLNMVKFGAIFSLFQGANQK